MNKNILFASLIVLFLAVMACEKVVCPDPEQNNTCQLTSSKFYYFDGTWYNEAYTYNAAGYLTGVTDTRQDGGFMSRQEYIYDGKRLKQKNLYSNANVKVAEFRYIYEGDKIKKEEYYELKPAAVLVFERTYAYKNGKLERVDEKNVNINTATYILYTHSGKNVTRIKTYRAADNVLTNDVEMEHDNKRIPLYAAFPAAVSAIHQLSANNNVRIKELVVNGQVSDKVYESTYSYNANGYPLEQSTEYGSKNIHEQSFTYNCK